MVWPDFQVQSAEGKLSIPPVSDRVLAFLFDVILFSPLFSILLTPVIRETSLRYYLDSQSSEFYFLVVLCILGYFSLATVFFTIAYFYFQTTPGKFFFKIKIISSSGSKITGMQAFERSFFQCLSFLTGGLVLIPSLGHPLRKTLHDRISETNVVSLKVTSTGQPLKGPPPLETKLVLRATQMFLGVLSLWVFSMAGQVFKSVQRGEFKKEELLQDRYLCPDLNLDENEKNISSAARVDLGLALFLASEIDESCLMSEADFALWGTDTDQRSWGYLAKSFYYKFDAEKSNQYLKQVCSENLSSESCKLSEKILQQEKGASLAGLKSMTAKILRASQMLGEMDLKNLASEMMALSKLQHFQSFAQRILVKSFWMDNQTDKSWGAYQASMPYMLTNHRLEISRWMCHESLDQGCSVKKYSACEDLREQMKNTNQDNPEDIYAVIRESHCKKTESETLPIIYQGLSKDRFLTDLFNPLIDSNRSQKLNLLAGHLFFGSKSWSNLERRYLLEYTQLVQSEKELRPVLDWLQSEGPRDWMWVKIFKSAFSKEKILLPKTKSNLDVLLGDLSSELRSSLVGSQRRLPAMENL